MFDNSNTDSDYLMAIERADEVLESAYNEAESGGATARLSAEMNGTKKKLDLVLANLKVASPNVRNQQMYRNMLTDLDAELESQNKKINAANERLDKIKDRVMAIRKDTLFMGIIKDSIRRKHFKNELTSLKSNFIRTSSLMKSTMRSLNDKKRQVVDRKMLASNALMMVENLLEKSGINVLGNECPNLWSISSLKTKNNAPLDILDKLGSESSIVVYYTSYSIGRLIALILFMGALGWYLKRSIDYLKLWGHFENLDKMEFKYLNRNVWLPVVVVGLSIAVVSNLYAPALFIEILQLGLLIVLTLQFRNDWSRKPLRNWVLLITLFVVLCFVDLFIRISFIDRCLFIAINLLGIRYGFIQLKGIREQLYIRGFFKWASIIFIGLNILALLFNVFGRVSLSHTLSLAAFISLTQIIALSVFMKIILEIILLQIYTMRVKRGVDKLFDHESLSGNLKKPLVLVITYMWVIVIASNLNIWESLSNVFSKLLGHSIKIGSFSFTLGGVLLFFAIIWLAHLLQKYVAYFFGEIDQEENEENINKRQHSKLLVTRLVVLIVGYLLAIAASGMPLDKISILLGALGVGVGLGLQSIVNNFVSGIILIFDRPIQVGDVIDVSSESGRVKSMGLRTTKLSAPNGAEIIIPNGSILSQNITNWTFTDNFKQVEVAFTVTGDIETEEINALVTEALTGIPLVNEEKPPQIFYSAVSDGSYKLLVKFWCSIYRTEEILSTARQELYNRFKDKGFTLSI